MDGSPYTPGAGHRPPVLAGRDELTRLWSAALNDVGVSGRVHALDIILSAPRGVGKTATVLKFEDLAANQGFEVISVQAARGNATLVESLLRRASSLSEQEAGPWRRARRAFERIASVNGTAFGVGAGISTHAPQPVPAGSTSPEDLAEALATLDQEVRRDRPQGGVLLTVDEIQASASSDLTLLAAALHGLNRHHSGAHVMFAASGLPNTKDVLDAAGVTHHDRLFDIYPVDLLLSVDEARYAVVEAARERGVSWAPEAADLIVQASGCYPAHLQVFADEAWRAAPGPDVIFAADAQAGVQRAGATLERRTLGPRFDRMSERQREFVTALAVLGGRATMSALAATLGRPRGSVSDLRDTLITEGDVFAPRRGEIELTVPVFASYLLANYDHAATHASTPLTSLEDMQRNREAFEARRSSRGQLPPGAALKLPRPASRDVPSNPRGPRD